MRQLKKEEGVKTSSTAAAAAEETMERYFLSLSNLSIKQQSLFFLWKQFGVKSLGQILTWDKYSVTNAKLRAKNKILDTEIEFNWPKLLRCKS